jgi:tetraacyldisaccharide 4'-kinase
MDILPGTYSLISRAAGRVKSALVRAGILSRRRAPIPVMSVGNLTVGGSEKTPLVMEILAFLEGRGTRAALVSRGYKGSWEQTGGILSDGTRLLGGWRESGDEPFMIAARFPGTGVYLGKHRFRSCLTAAAAGFEVAVLDDGFQHLKLARDLDIVIHDPASRSPFREGIPALRRADILLLKNPDPATAAGAPGFARGSASAVLARGYMPRASGELKARPLTAAALRAKFPALSVFEYAVEVKGLALLGGGELLPADSLRGRRISAFCGIARPGRFFETLEGLGLTPEVRTAFADHFAYPESAIARLAAGAAAGRTEAFVTTEKDAVKLLGRSEDFGPVPVYVLRIGLALPAAFFAKIEASLPTGKGASRV